MKENMKNFKLNYRLQSTNTKTKPIQAILSLSTKSEGKYLSVFMNIGESVFLNEWDAKKGLPTNHELARKLITLQEEMYNALTDYRECDDDTIIRLNQKNIFKSLLEMYINKVFRGIKPGNELAHELGFKYESGEREFFYNELKIKLQKENFKIVNEFGQVISPDYFFSTERNPIIQKLEPVIPEIMEKEKSDEENPLGEITFVHLIKKVAEKKFQRREIKSEKAYDTFVGSIEEYDDEIKAKDLSNDFFDEYFDYVLENNDINSIGSWHSYKKWAHAVLAYANSELGYDLPKNLKLKSKTFSKSEEEVTRPYFNVEQLMVMEKFKFNQKKQHLGYVLDLFLIQSHTGVRFSDVDKLFFNHQTKTVSGKKITYVEFFSKKTDTHTIANLNDVCLNILKKYNFEFKEISLPVYNRQIKDVMKEMGYVQIFHQIRTNVKTGERIKKETELNKLITTHTARRSYITNSLNHFKVEPFVLIQMTGHKTIDVLLKYNHASAEVKFDLYLEKVSI
jgi:hypothetical protein